MNKFSKTENNGQLNTSFSESVSFNHNYNCCYTLDKEQIDKKLEAEIADQKERTAHNGFVKKDRYYRYCLCGFGSCCRCYLGT